MLTTAHRPAANTSLINLECNKSMAGVSKSFPRTLLNMINWCEDMYKTHPLRKSIAWLPRGEGFIIFDPLELAKSVLPLFFKVAKYESFTRKMYRWGFKQKRISSEHTSNTSSHDCARIFRANGFHRDYPENCAYLSIKYSRKEILNQSRTHEYMQDDEGSLNISISKAGKFASICQTEDRCLNKGVLQATPVHMDISSAAARRLSALNYQIMNALNDALISQQLLSSLHIATRYHTQRSLAEQITCVPLIPNRPNLNQILNSYDMLNKAARF